MNTHDSAPRRLPSLQVPVVAVTLVLLAMAAPGLRAESYPGTQYVSGKKGHAQKVKGVLVVEEAELRFQDQDGAPLFTIPMAEVTGATDSREHDDGSFGRKVMLGVFASKTEEFLRVNTRTADSAEAVVFKCKKKAAPGMAAKINFYAERLRTAAAERQP
jgi:hypothetical protein